MWTIGHRDNTPATATNRDLKVPAGSVKRVASFCGSVTATHPSADRTGSADAASLLVFSRHRGKRPVDAVRGLVHRVRKAIQGHVDMRIRISDTALARDLLDYLRRRQCEAVQMGSEVIAVSLAPALPYEAALMELDLHLTDWRARHIGASAVIID